VSDSRIDFLSAGTAARFNTLRDEWRAAASSSKANRAGMRVATVLPGFVNREYGYAFPTDEDLSSALECDKKTVQRGLGSLEKVGLIERQDMPKRNDAGRMIGKLRRIYLTLPEAPANAVPKGQITEGTTALPKGQKQATEGTDGVVYILDKDTPDTDSTVIGRKVSAYAYTPTREGEPPVFRGDIAFLNGFDRAVIELTDGKDIGAGEIERLVQQAFDQTTDADELNMPVHWREICRLRQPETATWFRSRAGQLIHRRAA